MKVMITIIIKPLCSLYLYNQHIYFSNQFSLICNMSRWLCQCETGACQYHWCSIYRGLERVGSWVPGGSVGRDQLAMAAKVRRHWFNPCRLGSRGHLGADFSLLLYTDLIKKRKPSRHIYFLQKLDVSAIALFFVSFSFKFFFVSR